VPELSFSVERAAVTPFAVVPMLSFTLRVANRPTDEVIHTAVVRCQIQLDVVHRQYNSEEAAKLRDLFGERDRWASTLKSLLWTHVGVIIPSFTREITVEMPVPCTFDFNVAATKYFYALADGEVPLTFLFSGSVFYQDADGALQVAPIPWDREAKFRLPVKVWKDLMDHYYPNLAWLALRRDIFERLYRFKIARGIPTWEQTMEEATRV
jgi:hypothetical protein